MTVSAREELFKIDPNFYAMSGKFLIVIPAKAGIHKLRTFENMDSRRRVPTK